MTAVAVLIAVSFGFILGWIAFALLNHPECDRCAWRVEWLRGDKDERSRA